MVKTTHNDDETRLCANNDVELSFAMEEVELVMTYLCRTSGKINKAIIESTIIARRNYIEKGTLSVKMEISFWHSYHQLMSAIKPVTLSSIQQSNPSTLWEKKNPITAKRVKRVPAYYGICICIVILLTISFQTYYMIGIDVLKKTHQLFTERNILKAEISKFKVAKDVNKIEQHNKLVARYEKLDQEFDANRILLFDWNSFWQLGKSIKPKFSKFDDYNYQYKYNLISKAIIDNNVALTKAKRNDVIKIQQKAGELSQSLNEIERERHLNESRNLFYRSRLAAVNVVNLLESYLLPLLFGCLGAFTLVLRSLHNAFIQGTFTLKMCLDFNLRILLGGVMGISSGMFFGENLVIPEGQFSPMLIAFLIGYNVEILFSIMDNFAERLAIDNKRDSSK
jgi:hypothetical protein